MSSRRGAPGAAPSSLAEVLDGKSDGDQDGFAKAENGTEHINVNVTFIRHGHACHNALDKQGSGWHWGNKYRQAKYRDAPLTNCGMRLSKANGIRLSKASPGAPDFVGTSGLLRAIETGLEMFPGANIHPLPFIAEDGSDACNTPSDNAAQQGRLNATHGPTDAKRVKWQYINAAPNPAEVGASDYTSFKKLLALKVLPQLVANHPDRELTLAIVSHSKFMRTAMKKSFGCEKKDAYFDNNAAKSASYNFSFNKKGGEIEAVSFGEVAKSCTSIDFSPQVWTQKDFCQADYDRCSIADPKSMGLSEKDALGHKQSPSISHPDPAKRPEYVCCKDWEIQELPGPPEVGPQGLNA